MKILKENLVKKDITIEQLKKLVNTIYNKLNSIPKPSEYKVGGTYYGSTELLSQRGNMLEIINNYRTPGDYYSISINYKNCYAVKIGGAYKYDLYKDELDELRKIFNYRVQSGWGIYDQIITSDGYKVRLINEPGTNFSVFGFDILDAANESLEEAKQKTALKSNGVYSVMNDTWIKEPVAEDIPEVDREAFEKELKIWENKAKELLDSSKKELTESREEDLLKARSIIADQIRGEWDADRGYEKAAADLADLKDIDTKEAQDIMLDIASEEHVHVGELETAYDAFDPKLFDKLEDGHNEAEENAEPAKELDYDIYEEPIAEGLDLEDEEECAWCHEIFPVSELKVEKDLGPLCHQCIQAIESHEGKDNLDFEESLEITVDQDLADNRQPVENTEEEILSGPIDYKYEIAKEKRLAESAESDKVEAIDKFLEDIYELRKHGLQSADGEFSIQNLVFKEIRNKGYLDKLRDLKAELVSKDLSLKY